MRVQVHWLVHSNPLMTTSTNLMVGLHGSVSQSPTKRNRRESRFKEKPVLRMFPPFHPLKGNNQKPRLQHHRPNADANKSQQKPATGYTGILVRTLLKMTWFYVHGPFDRFDSGSAGLEMGHQPNVSFVNYYSLIGEKHAQTKWCLACWSR